MNLAIVIIGVGALFLIANTMGRNGRSAEPYFGDEDTGFLPDELIAPPIGVPTVPTVPVYEDWDVDPDYFGE